MRASPSAASSQPIAPQYRPRARALEAGDQRHRVVLGRAGDRSAREHGAQQFGHADFGTELRLHGRCHLEHRGVRLDREQGRHPHRSDPRKPAEVVAQEVDDHEVLGPVLDVQAEQACRFAVAFGCGHARGGALHRPGRQQAVSMAQEQLGRQRQHMRDRLPVGQRDERTVVDGLACTQPPVERCRRAEGRTVHAVRVVDLVGLAGADRLMDRLDRVHELGAVDAGLQVHHAGRIIGAGRVALGEPGIDVVARQALQAAKHQDPKRRRVARPDTGLQQLRAPFVVRQQDGVQAGALVGLHLSPHRVEAGRVDAPVLALEPLVQAAGGPRGGRGTVVQQRVAAHDELRTSRPCRA